MLCVETNSLMRKVRRGDTVEVISGNDAGKRGEVIRVNPRKKQLVVEGVNRRKKHQSQQQTGGQRPLAAGIVEFEGTLHISSVMLVCTKCDHAVRVGVMLEAGRNVRVCRRCDAAID